MGFALSAYFKDGLCDVDDPLETWEQEDIMFDVKSGRITIRHHVFELQNLSYLTLKST